jgi:N-acetylneuraminic acid mutarotase
MGGIVRILILLLVATFSSLAPAAAQGRWETAARLDAPRAGLAVVEHDGRLFAAGGSGLTTPRAEFESYDPAYDRWFPETPLPRGLEQFGMASLNGRIYAAGGYAPDETGMVGPSAAMWSWSADGNVWQSEVAMPAPKADFALIALDDRLYAIGGVRDDAAVHVFDPEAREWETLDIPAGVTRRGASTLLVDGEIHVIGGVIDGAASRRHDVFDPQSGSWREATPLAEARSGAAAALMGGRVHLFGGRAADGRTTLQSHVSWAPGETEWRAEAELPAPRTGAEAVVLSGGIYLVGGGSGGGFFAPFTAIDSTDVFQDDAS